MKKLFAIVLSLTLIFSTFGVRAKSVTFDDPPLFHTASLNTSAEIDKQKELKDGKLTLEFLEKISSWKELVNTTLPISDNYDNIENKEDYYSVMLIRSLTKTRRIYIYHDAKYVKATLGGINLKQIDYDRLMKKFQAIINIYNASNELQLVWESKILSENYMQVDVKSTNLIAFDYPAGIVGQQVVLKADSIYWESAWNDGSSRFGIATDDNCYIPEDHIVTDNGVAYLDKNRANVIKSYYKPYAELGEDEIDINFWKFRMLHICTETTDLGWVYAENVMRVIDCK